MDADAVIARVVEPMQRQVRDGAASRFRRYTDTAAFVAAMDAAERT